MLQMSRFATRKLLQQWNINCKNPVRLYQLSGLTLMRSQRKLVCKNVFEASLFTHVRLGVTSGPRCVWTNFRASTPFTFYSTSTHSRQAAEHAGSEVKTNDKPGQVSTNDFKKLLQLAHPERWRLSGKMHTLQLQGWLLQTFKSATQTLTSSIFIFSIALPFLKKKIK